jgi:hypothetical protein
MTYVLHTLGFLLLAIGQDNGRPMLFGAALLVPTALLVSFIRIRTSGMDISTRLHLLWVYGLFSIICLIVLTGFRNDDTFLQVCLEHLVDMCLTELGERHPYRRHQPCACMSTFLQVFQGCQRPATSICASDQDEVDLGSGQEAV